jgi:hypothetical protein
VSNHEQNPAIRVDATTEKGHARDVREKREEKRERGFCNWAERDRRVTMMAMRELGGVQVGRATPPPFDPPSRSSREEGECPDPLANCKQLKRILSTTQYSMLSFTISSWNK